MTSTHWNPVQALLWILFHDAKRSEAAGNVSARDALDKMLNEVGFDHIASRVSRQTPIYTLHPGLVEAERMLWERFGTGTIAITVEGQNGRAKLPTEEWRCYSFGFSPDGDAPFITYRSDRFLYPPIHKALISTADLMREFDGKPPKVKAELKKRGPKETYDWPAVRERIFRIMDDEGDFSPVKPGWTGPTNLIDRLRSEYFEPYSQDPATSTLFEKVEQFVAEWRAAKQ